MMGVGEERENIGGIVRSREDERRKKKKKGNMCHVSIPLTFVNGVGANTFL